MNRPEYLLVMLSVLVGMGLTDLLQTVHQLVHRRRQVRWYWLPIAWAGLVLLLLLQTWWAYYRTIQARVWSNLFAFLVPLSLFIFLYLICAASLPTPEADEPIDLETFYFAQRLWFFGLLLGFLGVSVLASTVAYGALPWGGDVAFRGVGAVMAITLARSESRRVHGAVTGIALVLLVLYILFYMLRLD